MSEKIRGWNRIDVLRWIYLQTGQLARVIDNLIDAADGAEEIGALGEGLEFLDALLYFHRFHLAGAGVVSLDDCGLPPVQLGGTVGELISISVRLHELELIYLVFEVSSAEEPDREFSELVRRHRRDLVEAQQNIAALLLDAAKRSAGEPCNRPLRENESPRARCGA